MLDSTTFRPSDLESSRQAEIRRAFTALHLPPARGSRPHEVLLRNAPGLGPNALALPSGLLVLFDDLERLARDDREILGILAHEAGHVAGRHGERELLQSSAVALLVTWFIGDISAMAAVAPTALLQAKYSRDFEREADDHAATMLRANASPLTISPTSWSGSPPGRRLAAALRSRTSRRIRQHASASNACAQVRRASEAFPAGTDGPIRASAACRFFA